MDFTTVLTDGGNGISLQTYFDKGNITFDRIELGSQINLNPEQSTALAHKQIAGQFLGIEKNNDGKSAIIKFTYDNKDVTEKFEFLEYGIWATYTTDSGDEIECLYAYGYSNSGKGTEIPAFTGSKSYIKDKLNVALEIGSPDNISVYLGEYEDYVSKENFEEHLKDTSNPHKVTKAQIGLENVENVSINEAVPVIEQSVLDVPAPTIEQYGIQQGDKVSVLWAKTKRAISNLFSHLKDYKNPHNVTFEQLTGAKNLSEFLKKIITDGNQNIELRNARYIRGQSTDGKTHSLIGIGTDNNVYIGNDEAKYVHLHGNENICIRVIDGSYYKYLHINKAGTIYASQINIASGAQGATGANVGSSTYRYNTVYAKNALNTSDRKNKENITDAQIGYEILKRLSVVQFNFIGETEIRCGVIAQELFKLFQELGIHNSGVYQASVVSNDYEAITDKNGNVMHVPKIHSEFENLSDEEILKYDDAELTWNVDYNTLTYYCIAGFQAYMNKTEAEISKIKKLLEVHKDE